MFLLLPLLLTLTYSNDVKSRVVDDDDHSSLPFGDELEMAFDEPTETPTPKPRSTLMTREPIPLKKIVCLREFIILVLAIIYLIFFFIGRSYIRLRASVFFSKLIPLLRDEYFAIVPDEPLPISYHEYRLYITGRTFYQGAFLKAVFPSSCDPLGFLYSIVTGRSVQLTIEFILEPKKDKYAYFRVTKELYNFATRLKDHVYRDEKCIPKYIVFHDYDRENKNAVSEYIAKYVTRYPKKLVEIDLSDLNYFITRKESRYVGRFIFNIRDPIKDLDNELVKFMVYLCDYFIEMNVDDKINERNRKSRTEEILSAYQIKTTKEKAD